MSQSTVDRSGIFSQAEASEAMQRFSDLVKETIPTRLSDRKVSEWAESKRTLPVGLSPYPGPYNFEVVPYMREIVDSLSDSSPVREVAVMKGTQIAYTVGVLENWIGYTIDEAPAPMLYVTATGSMAETQMQMRVDAMIVSAGLGGKIGPQFIRKGQRKSGDVKVKKEFPGGFLMASGPNSISSLRSFSYQKIAVDECDAFGDKTKDEGDSIYLIRRRADAYTETAKFLWGSTPLFEHNSKIKPLYLQGDQRKYFVPCKHCKKLQFLKWDNLRFDQTDEGRLVCKINSEGRIVSSSVRYECEFCGGHWHNEDKDFFMKPENGAKWIPTEKNPANPLMRSYHLPALYSPVGFRSWEDAIMEFLSIKNEGFPKLKYQNFVNTFLAETFVDTAEKPRIEVLLTRERRYRTNTLPPEALPLVNTLAADVQGDRIECEIVAWGMNAESWSIDYRVFPGDTENLSDPCWQQLRETILSDHCGKHLTLSGIDAGFRPGHVYEFCDGFETGVHPVMGTDALHGQNLYTKISPLKEAACPRIDMNVDLLKQELYSFLKKAEYEDGRRPTGFCHFPADYGKKHFDQLLAESRKLVRTRTGVEKWVWDAGERRNERLDIRVYNLGLIHALKDFVTESVGKENLDWLEFWGILRDGLDV
jgi:phage terminase large subunit GpA-like protein